MKKKKKFKERKKKVLEYYEKFFNNEITITSLHQISGLSGQSVYQILLDEKEKEKERNAEKRREKLEDSIDYTEYEKAKKETFNKKYSEYKEIKPSRIRVLSKNKVEVTYPSKINNYKE